MGRFSKHFQGDSRGHFRLSLRCCCPALLRFSLKSRDSGVDPDRTSRKFPREARESTGSNARNAPSSQRLFSRERSFGASGKHFGTIFGDFSKQVGTEANAPNAPSSKRPAQAAQRPSKGIQRSTLLAICILALLSPRRLCCSSWPRALVSLVVLASLLVFCVACNACGSRVERASRSMIARFHVGLKFAPRAPRERPRGAKSSPRGAKRCQERHKRAPRAPKRRQEASGSDSLGPSKTLKSNVKQRF